jgi:hypothetical protein
MSPQDVCPVLTGGAIASGILSEGQVLVLGPTLKSPSPKPVTALGAAAESSFVAPGRRRGGKPSTDAGWPFHTALDGTIAPRLVVGEAV